jgi:phospholipid/cholesterol/gamma-HCH transport system substrate-binding protein
MSEQFRNFLIGLFVLAALSALGILMVWFGETPTWLSRSEWTLRITGVYQLRGIGEGSPVYMNGVQIGRVTAIEFQNPEQPGQGVVVVTRIGRRYNVPQGAYAKIYGATFGFGTGQVDIVIEPGASTDPVDRELAIIRGEMRNLIYEFISRDAITELERMVEHIGGLAAAAKPVAENLADLLERRTVAEVDRPDAVLQGTVANLSTAIERFDRFLANANEVIGEEAVKGDLKTAINDLRQAATLLKETMAVWNTKSASVLDNVNTGIDQTEANLDSAFVRLNATLEQLDDAASALARVAQRMEKGEGTLGLLTKDPRLYESAVVSFERLAELIGSLQRITGKIERDGYITIGQQTAVGTFTKDFPVGPEASSGKAAGRQ